MNQGVDTVVIINQDALGSDALKFVLETKNVVVYSYVVLKDALKHIILTPPDLVIIDQLQAGIKPGDIVGGIRRKIKDFHQPFLFVLDPPYTEESIEFYNPNLDGYLSRPYALDRMIESVFTLLKRQDSSLHRAADDLGDHVSDSGQVSSPEAVQEQPSPTQLSQPDGLDVDQSLELVPSQDDQVMIGDEREDEQAIDEQSPDTGDQNSLDPARKGYMGTILVIDDEPFIIRILKTILEAEGYRVLTADNGLEGMKKCKEIIPDVILVDLMMPELNGYEFIEIMRAEKEFDNVPIIILSARPLTKDQGHAFKLGANFYMQKPIEKEKLLHVLDNLIHEK
ncbi:response regulator [bacterium]|nr:response regulator [bacterium]